MLLFAITELLFGVLEEIELGLWQASLLFILGYVSLYTLSPRFVLSIRELYAHDARRGNEVDTGFGLSSRCDAGVSTIAFADVEPGHDEELDSIEEIARGDGPTQTE